MNKELSSGNTPWLVYYNSVGIIWGFVSLVLKGLAYEEPMIINGNRIAPLTSELLLTQPSLATGNLPISSHQLAVTYHTRATNWKTLTVLPLYLSELLLMLCHMAALTNSESSTSTFLHIHELTDTQLAGDRVRHPPITPLAPSYGWMWHFQDLNSQSPKYRRMFFCTT